MIVEIGVLRCQYPFENKGPAKYSVPRTLNHPPRALIPDLSKLMRLTKLGGYCPTDQRPV